MIGSQCKREESEPLMSADLQRAFPSHVSRPLEVL